MRQDSYLEQVARGQLKLTPANTARVARLAMLFFVLDVSGSMSWPCGNTTRLHATQLAVLQLIARLMEHGVDVYLAIMAFHNRARLVLPMTRFRDCPDRVEKEIMRLTSGGGTDLSAPFRMLLRKGLIENPHQTRLIMLSDGHGGDPREAAARIKAQGSIIETIGVADTPADVAELHLKTAASVQDGKVLYRFIRDADTLVNYFQTEIANRLVKRS